MPRSSYSAQYLNYGHIPTYKHKGDGVQPFPDASLTVKSSTYQQEYKDKLDLIKTMDIRDLDCTRDKFKYSISYQEIPICHLWPIQKNHRLKKFQT